MPSTTALAALVLRRVLIVEDDAFLADEMARALRRLGADIVGPAPTIDQALTLLEAEPVDMAVLDINLQGEMVFPAAAALRAQGVPFVFTTGYGKGIIPPEYRDAPRWEKPFQIEALVAALPGIVQGPQGAEPQG